MNIKFLLLTILFACKIAYGQVVASSCLAPDSVVAMYKDDADRLTVKRINAIQAIYKDSIKIPKTWSDTVMNALIAVYNATTLPARNTIVALGIHTFPIPTLTDIDVSADSNLFWIHQLRSNIIPTGFASLDSLLTAYYLHVAYYHDYSHILSYHTVTLQSDSNYNISPLSNKFAGLNGVMYAQATNIAGDGNNITDSILPTYVKLIYSYGWQDCPSGCIYRHYWEFKIYYDCSVEFVGEYGSPYSTTDIPKIARDEISIYPNPANSQFTIATNSTDKQVVDLYDVNGKHILNKILGSTADIDTKNLENGVYTLIIKSKISAVYKKLIIAR